MHAKHWTHWVLTLLTNRGTTAQRSNLGGQGSTQNEAVTIGGTRKGTEIEMSQLSS